MFLTIALNLAPAIVLVGGWSLAVWRLHQGLDIRPATARRAAGPLPEADLPRERVLPASSAA